MSTKRKIVKIGNEARNELIIGANFLADAVRSTMGPFGCNFFLEKKNRITNDGVTIAREMELPDEIQNRGVEALREAAVKTNEEVGDGTTTAITLAQAILKEAVKLTGNGTSVATKKSPIEVIRQIEMERKEITEKLVAMAEPIESEEDMIHSATVSVEDEELGKLIGKAQWQLGKDGVLIAEDTTERECSVEMVNGVRIDNGFGTSAAINNFEKQSLEVSNPTVIMSTYVFTDPDGLEPILPLLKSIYKIGIRDVVIIGRAFSVSAMKHIVRETEAGFKLYPVNAPYTDQVEVMKDLEAVLGGKFCNAEEMDISDLQISDVGMAANISAKRFTAVITGKQDEKAKERLAKRVEVLQKKLKGSTSDFESKLLKERIAQLTVGFGIVKIGATSEKERGYKKDKADDAVNATRAALLEGVVPGAGMAFKTISESLPETYILKKPLLAIYEQIKSTAPADFVVPEWVKDPVKVLRIALEKACSVAGTFASTGGVTATENDKPMWVKQADNIHE